jgi:hypothetical protein
MQGDNHPSKTLLRTARQATIDRLTAAFVADELSLEEYEERIDGAYKCRQPSELDTLTADLSAAARAMEEQARAIVPAMSDPALELRPELRERPSTSRTLALLGNTEVRGPVHLDASHAALSVLGNLELDLRGVTLGPGVTTLHVSAVLGSVEITVPPSLIVECDGHGVLGSFSGVSHVPAERAADEPVLRIVGRAILGTVDVRTLPLDMPAQRLLPAR